LWGHSKIATAISIMKKTKTSKNYDMMKLANQNFQNMMALPLSAVSTTTVDPKAADADSRF